MAFTHGRGGNKKETRKDELTKRTFRHGFIWNAIIASFILL
jgi:hypothetical protein